MSNALPAVDPEDAAQRFAALDDVHAVTRGNGSAGGGCRAAVGDDVARIDH